MPTPEPSFASPASPLKPAAFYGRVSTDGLQEPIMSKGWQLRLIKPLALANGYEIVAEYFDEDTRQLPWKLRPVTKQLLDDLADPNRGWDALYLAEPHRAFMGTQYADVLPLFAHYRVAVFAPEYPASYDHDNAAHQMQIAFHGVNAEAEVMRTSVRVTTGMEVHAETGGRFLGGRPPYGYQLVDVGIHPNQMKARGGTQLHQLALDPATAPVIRRIFDEYLAGAGLKRIAKGLVADGIPTPSAHDPERNSHRDTSGTAWCTGTLRGFLNNPRYTGHEVWKRTAGERVLRDVNNVSLGKKKVTREQPPDEWIWSLEPSHTAIITMDEYNRIQSGFRSRATGHGARPSKHPYMASGVVRCGICQRKMNGHWLRNKAGYRCVYPSTHALPADNGHPKTVYLKEQDFLRPLADWLTGLFSPENIDQTCSLLAQATDTAPDPNRARRDDAARRLQATTTRIARCEAMLDDPNVDPRDISKWLSKAQAERDAARMILDATPPVVGFTAADFRRIIEALPDPASVFADGDADDVKQLLQGLGVELVYDPNKRLITASADPSCCATESVGGPT